MARPLTSSKNSKPSESRRLPTEHMDMKGKSLSPSSRSRNLVLFFVSERIGDQEDGEEHERDLCKSVVTELSAAHSQGFRPRRECTEGRDPRTKTTHLTAPDRRAIVDEAALLSSLGSAKDRRPRLVMTARVRTRISTLLLGRRCRSPRPRATGIGGKVVRRRRRGARPLARERVGARVRRLGSLLAGRFTPPGMLPCIVGARSALVVVGPGAVAPAAARSWRVPHSGRSGGVSRVVIGSSPVRRDGRTCPREVVGPALVRIGEDAVRLRQLLEARGSLFGGVGRSRRGIRVVFT